MPEHATATNADADLGESADTVVLGLRIPPTLHDKLVGAAEKMATSKAAAARMAINYGLDQILKRLELEEPMP